jgi:hypothetical protein
MTMKKFKFLGASKRIAYLAMGVFVMFACKPKTEDPLPEPETVLEAKLQLVYNGVNINLDQTLFTQEGYPFQLKEVKIILTQMKNGERNFLDASLMDMALKGNTLFSGVGLPSDFANLNGAIGVVQPWNNADPISFPTTSPLYLTNVNDMHWGWNPGYIFYKIEGLFSTNPDAINLTDVFTYHIGLNQYRKTFEFNNIEWIKVSDHLYRMTVYLHLDDLFDGPGGTIDLAVEPFTHTTPDKAELNEKVATNFAHALRN